MSTEARKINGQALYDAITMQETTNIWDVLEVSEAIYLNVKVVGIEDTIMHYEENGKEVQKAGKEIPEKMRAFAVELLRQRYRWDDGSLQRLEQHFGLQLKACMYLNMPDYSDNFPYTTMKAYWEEYCKRNR